MWRSSSSNPGSLWSVLSPIPPCLPASHRAGLGVLPLGAGALDAGHELADELGGARRLVGARREPGCGPGPALGGGALAEVVVQRNLLLQRAQRHPERTFQGDSLPAQETLRRPCMADPTPEPRQSPLVDLVE